jgi:hypothetical protein
MIGAPREVLLESLAGFYGSLTFVRPDPTWLVRPGKSYWGAKVQYTWSPCTN